MAGPPCPLGNGQGHKPFIFNLGCSLVPSDVRPLGGSCICDRPYAPGKKALLGKGRWVELSSCVPGADPCQPAPSPSQQPQAWMVADLPCLVTLSAQTPEITTRACPEQPPCLAPCYLVLQEPTGFSHSPGAQPCRGFRKGLGLPGQGISIT